MEADWEVEIGGGAPVIDACWSGFVDLRKAPEGALHFPEAKHLTWFAELLKKLNAPDSPVWTSKCDVWRIGPADFDADELDADPGSAACAVACYIDVLEREDRERSNPEHAVAYCKWVCERLGRIALSNCRADLIVRQARIAPEDWSYGVTVYLTACGPSADQATERLSVAARGLATCLSRPFCPTQR